MSSTHESGTDRESARERVERLIAEGRLARDTVREAERIWMERLQHGVRMPNDVLVRIALGDLYHVIIDGRVARRPERIE